MWFEPADAVCPVMAHRKTAKKALLPTKHPRTIGKRTRIRAMVVEGNRLGGPYAVHDLCADRAVLSGSTDLQVGADVLLHVRFPHLRAVCVSARVLCREGLAHELRFVLALHCRDEYTKDRIQRAVLSELERRSRIAAVLVVDGDDVVRTALAREIEALG